MKLDQTVATSTALALLEAHYRAEAAPLNTKMAAAARAEFDGMCNILSKLRLAPTPFAVDMAITVTISQAPEKLPVFSFASRNAAFHKWMRDRALEVAMALGWLEEN